MVDFQYKSNYDVNDFRRVMEILRGENGCPWDREQTHESIRRNVLEEAYEVVEAIDEKSPEHLKEELGDLLMQVMFHARMEEETGGFNLDDVADGAVKKLILRHPHIFGSVQVADSAEVLKNWDDIKRREKGQATTAKSMIDVAETLPALWRAEKIQKKAAKVGFDWPDVSGALDKLDEEIAEVRAAAAGDGDVTEELGDLLFSAVNAARFLHVDPEMALHAASDKFAARFRLVEQEVLRRGQQMDELPLSELDAIWDQIKHQAT